ncbi:16S rRNA (guanine(527)-N(7))-methyltransferase RsmG [Ectothiorhodospira mobilis]|uniref:16S rRNA (guanine(527)-N(7))-methyltransferase RsmG n=1 Tax=Ectothiorhodospira mobilis TaxID=195064 RepID=UPI001EE8741C|nr:16S rRNA (guanine(527)-N(7))-methyltransferase RsmG [Ectothiorhodospira mobilis]
MPDTRPPQSHPFPLPHARRAEERLLQGLETLGLDPALAPPLMAYLGLLLRWNRAYNLTAVRDPLDMVTLHLLDSLAVLPQVQGPRLLDVGSGAGLPGIPLALARPDWAVTLLDAVGKKVRFLRQAALELGLGQLEPVHARVETYRPQQGFDTVISRAFAATGDFVRLAGPLCTPGGRLLAMKGRDADDAAAALPAGWGVAATHPLRVPGLPAARHLVEIRRL